MEAPTSKPTEEDEDIPPENIQKPSKKKKKKKKKSTAATSLETGNFDSSKQSEPNAEYLPESHRADCQAIPEEKPESSDQYPEQNAALTSEVKAGNPDCIDTAQEERLENTAVQAIPESSAENEKKSNKKKKGDRSNSTLNQPTSKNLEEKEAVTNTIESESSIEGHSRSGANKEKMGSPPTGQKKKKKKAKGILLSDVNLTEPQNGSDKEKKDPKVSETENLCDKSSSANLTDSESDLKRFSKDTSLLNQETREKNNLSRIVILINGLGLDTLRNLFMKIHPSWSNKPNDATKMDKGKMKLKDHELNKFNSGNINDWDVSLITTVLLYSKECAKELHRRPGFEDAIRTIKTQRNEVISHVASEKMTDDEFKIAWRELSNSLLTIGASHKDIDDIYKDDNLESAKFYRDLLLQDMANQNVTIQDIHSKIEAMGDKVAEKVARRLICRSNSKNESQPSFQDLSGPKWDEWIRFCDNVKDFNHEKNNYILITDRMPAEDLKNFSVLRSVPWKFVLDFDPASEERGMYSDFAMKEDQNILIEMMTPDEIRRHHGSTIGLARSIDSRKTQWLFVNGREKDNPGNESVNTQLYDWKCSSLKYVSRFLSCCSDPENMDKHKPVVCVILPFLKQTTPFIDVTIERLIENFDEFSLGFVALKHENTMELQKRVNIDLTALSPALLGIGLKDLLQVSIGKEYRMPTFQAKLSMKLTNHQYLFLQEYLDVMYDGCEDLPKVNNDEDEEKLNTHFNNHREAFLSGNWISFVSLYDYHDAKRELGAEVQNHIQRLIEQGPTHSTIIEIRHSPGTGGTTIARRVLWDLHKSYPCAIARLEDYKFDFDDDILFINALAERVSAMQDICQMNPLILLDGNHARIEALSNKLVRVLNSRGQRAVLLRCMHRTAKTTEKETNTENPDVHARFFVKVKLEDSKADLRQFEEKYRDFIDEIKKSDPRSPSRVFHFPLLAMLKGLEGFNSKLKHIIYESFDEMDGLRQKIAAVVAFIQFFAYQETPGSLICKAFKSCFKRDNIDKGTTYKDINQLLTEQLLSLMVPAKPSRNPNRGSSTSSATESYTLQHPLVAEMVLRRYYETHKCDVFSLTRDFLGFPIFNDSEFFSLVNALFIKNRSSVPKARVSVLFDKLKALNPTSAAEIFRELAEKTSDAVMFAHAARFHAKNNPPLFQEAKGLITQAFQCKNAQSRTRIIYDFKGHILQTELKILVEKNKIESIFQLKQLADEAVQSYKKSRNWPLSYPWPLMGEVKVWISCIDWITKNKCNGDTNRAFEFIISEAPTFFRTCVGDSLNLLDVLDNIVQNEASLAEPEEIQMQCNDLRLTLLKAFKRDLVKGTANKRAGIRSENDQDIIRACKALCSPKKFPKSSPIELKRLQVYFIWNSIDQLESTAYDNIMFLLKLLEDLVLTDKRCGRVGMASYLMKVCILISGHKHYTLERGLSVTKLWIEESDYDPMPYYYRMMIAFLMILDGNQMFYRSVYQKSHEKCKEKSQNQCRRLMSNYFLKKTGDGMDRLMTRGALLSGETEYRQNIEDFWTTQSRKKLKECKGRIRTRSKSGKRKQAYIELVEGNIELYVGKNADIGQVERDYPQDTVVYFVVGFNLEGPVANGITFKPTSQS